MRSTRVDPSDILALAGSICLVVGLALWWVPAAWMGGGALLLGLALWSALRTRTP